MKKCKLLIVDSLMMKVIDSMLIDSTDLSVALATILSTYNLSNNMITNDLSSLTLDIVNLYLKQYSNYQILKLEDDLDLKTLDHVLVMVNNTNRVILKMDLSDLTEVLKGEVDEPTLNYLQILQGHGTTFQFIRLVNTTKLSKDIKIYLL